MAAKDLKTMEPDDQLNLPDRPHEDSVQLETMNTPQNDHRLDGSNCTCVGGSPSTFANVNCCIEAQDPEFSYLEPFVSQHLVDMAYYGVAVGTVLNVHYFQLDTVQRRLLLNNYKNGNLGWYLGIFVSLLYTAFSLFQLINCFRTGSNNKENLAILGFALIMCALPVMLQLEFRYSRDELASFFNNSCAVGENYMKYLSREQRLKKSFELKFCEYFLALAYISSVVMVFLCISASIVAPEVKLFPSSLCPDPNSSCHYPMRVVSVIMLVYLVYVCASGVLLYCCGLCTVFTWLAGIKSMLSFDIDRFGAEIVVTMYKRQKLLFDSFNRSCVLLLPVGEYILMSVSIFGLYGALRLKGILRVAIPSMSFLAYCTAIIAFSALAQVYTTTAKLLTKWRRDPRFDRRDLRTMVPIRVVLGTYAYVDPGITLTILDVIASQSISLLLLT